jgi:CopG family nickel-responsive transcriptional regulator
MADLSRIGIAIESDLLADFDHLISERGYGSRSEAFRDMIRDALITRTAERSDSPVVGTITLVYKHRHRQLSDRLTSAQHDFHHVMRSTLHVHLDHDHCLEVIVVQGAAGDVRRIADRLIAMKGVTHGRLTVTAVGNGGHERAVAETVDLPHASRVQRRRARPSAR